MKYLIHIKGIIINQIKKKAYIYLQISRKYNSRLYEIGFFVLERENIESDPSSEWSLVIGLDTCEFNYIMKYLVAYRWEKQKNLVNNLVIKILIYIIYILL